MPFAFHCITTAKSDKTYHILVFHYNDDQLEPLDKRLSVIAKETLANKVKAVFFCLKSLTLEEKLVTI